MGQDGGGSEFLTDPLPATSAGAAGSGSGVGNGGGGSALPAAGAASASPFDAPPAGQGNAVQEILATSAHPTVAVFHVAFKMAAIASYLLLGIFTKSFVVHFVLTVTLLAFDFWTVKNVSGRLLVGLRWWNDVDEDGAGTWRFETIQVRPGSGARVGGGRGGGGEVVLEWPVSRRGTVLGSGRLFVRTRMDGRLVGIGSSCAL